ncbi:MAG: hypothetical protein FWG65_13080 [Turicibacter sp.]|nr:hypothetical protein [Turicibacter sp.]
MTQKDLKEFVNLKSELETVKERLANIAKYGGEAIKDFAKDYKTGYPKVITIEGISQDKVQTEITKSMLESRQKAHESYILRIENFINNIPDTRIRNIVTLRYVDGKSWDEVAKKSTRN